jgi:hypothetical protein
VGLLCGCMCVYVISSRGEGLGFVIFEASTFETAVKGHVVLTIYFFHKL